MSKIIRSAQIWHSVEAMFDIVDDVEHYPDFLPWCTGSEIISCDYKTMIAQLTISYGSLKYSFTTRNVRSKPDRIDLFLVDGPFKKFEGYWKFSPITPSSSEVTLTLDFAFSNWLVSASIGRIFSVAAETMVDAFVERACLLHPEEN